MSFCEHAVCQLWREPADTDMMNCGPRPVYIFLSSCSDRSDTRPSLLRPHLGPCSAAANHASKRTEIKNKQVLSWTALLSWQTCHHHLTAHRPLRLYSLNLCLIIFNTDKLSQTKRGLRVCWNESAPCWGTSWDGCDRTIQRRHKCYRYIFF